MTNARFIVLPFTLALLSTPLPGAPRQTDSLTETSLARYDNLNLALPADRDKLRIRIESAAREVCLVGVYSSRSPVISDPSCVRASIKEGLAQMDRLVAAQASSSAASAGVAGMSHR